MTATRGQHCSAPPRHRLNQIFHCFLVLFAIPVAIFGGVDRGSEVEVVAGAHFYPADPISVLWDSSSAIWKAIEAPKYDLLGLMPCCRRRLRTVCELIFRNPGIPTAVIDADTVRFRR